MKIFPLTPFSSTDISDSINITGSIERSYNKLTIHYSLTGDISELAIPEEAGLPERRNSIWEETCFELFLSAKYSDNYWEFNLSPAGHWNVYRFSSYRNGRLDETAFTALPFKVSNDPDAIVITIELDLDKIKLADRRLNAGISAVIKQRDGMITHWALTHPGARADFHLRDSFIIEL